GSPLLAGQVQVEVPERAQTANGEAESRREPRRGFLVDQKLGAVTQLSEDKIGAVVASRGVTDADLADLAAPATPMDVIGNHPPAGRRVHIEVIACLLVVGIDPKCRAHAPDYGAPPWKRSVYERLGPHVFPLP